MTLCMPSETQSVPTPLSSKKRGQEAKSPSNKKPPQKKHAVDSDCCLTSSHCLTSFHQAQIHCSMEIDRSSCINGCCLHPSQAHQSPLVCMPLGNPQAYPRALPSPHFLSPFCLLRAKPCTAEPDLKNLSSFCAFAC